MLSFRNLSIAVAATLAFAPAAFAQDASDSAASKRFAVTGGYAHMKPKSDALENAPGKTGFDGGGMPTLSGSWYATDNFAVELWGAADKSEQRVRADGANVGSIKQQPVAVSGQYHFGTAGQAIRPFVGLGYYESNVSDEKLNGQHVGLTTPKGAIGTVGADFNINERWFTRADARYMKGDADIKSGDVKVGEAQMDPWVVGVGVGARF
ncbi:outer membrane beta-barrel protein [Luteimonas sp. SX5]|uniref:Outer membrane beta-barrel protein n=1 Tax=Luteimonas galliterrae TaxID=2940486 RepID=A0ABT0ML81_9GAMM|nr:OmpW family outer membrane protein [Luteimonas galliterrae]MCL1635645.1 outer membrane beta-barrel protein [Luteimonas galliterrae]